MRSSRRTPDSDDDTETTPSLYEGSSKIANSKLAYEESLTSTAATPFDTDEAPIIPHFDQTTVAILESIATQIATVLGSSGEHEVVFQVQWPLICHLERLLVCSYGEFSKRQPEIYNALRYAPVFTAWEKHLRGTTSEKFLRSQWKSFTQRCNIFQLLSNTLASQHPYGKFPSSLALL